MDYLNYQGYQIRVWQENGEHHGAVGRLGEINSETNQQALPETEYLTTQAHATQAAAITELRDAVDRRFI